MANDSEITERLDRVQIIIEQLDGDEYGPKEGKELYEEGHQLLAEVQDILSDGSGDVVELE
jgi:exodeoxyribonuclease VII small subunit